MELIGSTIGDCEGTCQRSRTHRMGSRVRIVVNPVDGVVVLMGSKQSQDVLRQTVSLRKNLYVW